MINEVSIQNYKCFHNTKIEGFERVNLIGGLNNSGKTVLLEALHLTDAPNFNAKLKQHRGLRGESRSTGNGDYLFYKYKNTDNIIKISLSQAEVLYISNNRDLYSRVPNVDSYSDIGDDDSLFYVKTQKERSNVRHYDISNFISPSEPFDSSRLVLEYNKAQQKEAEANILKFLQIIDKSISEVQVSIIEGAHLRVKKGNEGVIPLTALGDAAKKVVRIALSVLNGEHKAIFIDEIENGIHYTAHQEFWRLLFYIAQTLDVQVFATTHSLEMIKAYQEVSTKQGVVDATYFELFRHGKTNEHVGRKLDMERLQYKLERNLELHGE